MRTHATLGGKPKRFIAVVAWLVDLVNQWGATPSWPAAFRPWQTAHLASKPVLPIVALVESSAGIATVTIGAPFRASPDPPKSAVSRPDLLPGSTKLRKKARRPQAQSEHTECIASSGPLSFLNNPVSAPGSSSKCAFTIARHRQCVPTADSLFRRSVHGYRTGRSSNIILKCCHLPKRWHFIACGITRGQS